MSNTDIAHVANCSGQALPDDTSYDTTLCCEIAEICTDGIDNDGDGLTDCADPECNAASTGPGPHSSSPQVCHPPSCPATLHEDLHGFYQFENNTADNAASPNDLSVEHGTATYTNTYSGKRGLALQATFDQDKFQAGDVLAPFDADGDSMTVMAWVNPNASSGTHTVVDLQRSGGGDAHRLVWDASSEEYAFQTPQTTLRASAPRGEWRHVTAVVDADDGETRLYVNTSEEASDSVVSSWGRLDVAVADEVTDNAASGSQTARIDQVRVYDRALNDSEIQSFTDLSCNNRQRTVECVNSPELCDTDYAASNNYHCNYGQYDDPQNTDYGEPSKEGTGVCCPQDEDAEWDDFNDQWVCNPTTQCGMGPGERCTQSITSDEDAFFAEKSDGTDNECNSQVPNLHVNTDEQAPPEKRSQACCYVPKDSKVGYFYKDGNVKVYG